MRDGLLTQPDTPWHALPAERVAATLESDLATGLGEAEAARRRERYGPNTLTVHERRGVVRLFVSQFRSVLILVLVVAMAISLLVREWLDAGAIFAILILNAALGTVQEYRAGSALEALRRMATRHATVIRDGASARIVADDVVPGDLVEVSEGDTVPADLRLTETAGLEVDESALTGESFPVGKDLPAVATETALADRTCILHAGTVVTRGRGRGLVTATGMATEFGAIARAAGRGREERTPLEHGLDRTGRQLAAAALVASALVFGANLVAGSGFADALLVAIALAVAAVPEGLPATVTVVLALGVRRMASRHAIVRRLAAVETLGSTSIICSDKTGTLTRNELSVQRVWTPRTGEDDSPAPELRRFAALSIVAGEGGPKEPTDLAIARFGAAGDELGRADAPELLAEHPFDVERRLSSAVYRGEDGPFVVVKGAPEAVLDRCSRPAGAEGDDWRERADEAIEAFARSGLRPIGLATRMLPGDAGDDRDEAERDLRLLAIFGLIDALRPEARESVATAQGAGVRTVMITGDHPATARAIAADLGLGEAPDVRTGRDLVGLPEAELRDLLAGAAVFARVTSEDKLRIVRAFRASGLVVAVTGDGVNDAPALEEADVGVAMGRRGTDAARGAADLVLADDNFASIVAAIEEGRTILANIQRFLMYSLAGNAAEILVVLVGALSGSSPLLPVQILWVNLLTDGLPALALGVEPRSPEVMRRPPRSSRTHVLTRSMVPRMALTSALIAVPTLVAFGLGMRSGGIEEARPLAFGTLIVSHVLAALTFRSSSLPLHRLGPWGNRPLLYAVGATLLLQVVAFTAPPLRAALSTAPLSAGQVLLVVTLSLPALIVPEMLKAAGWMRDGTSAAGGARAA